jgi:hypothetical protein
MNPNDRRDERQAAQANDTSEERDRNGGAEGDRAEAPGSTILDTTPSTQAAKGASDNPVRQLSRDAGDVLADEVREGWAESPTEERDRLRGR